jgi:hypothetical protein
MHTKDVLSQKDLCPATELYNQATYSSRASCYKTETVYFVPNNFALFNTHKYIWAHKLLL